METVYSSKLSPVKPGQTITIFARSRPDASRFEIELSEADNGSHEVPFLISVRFGHHMEIVRNSHSGAEGFGDEERNENVFPGNEANPIVPGEAFKLSIFIDETDYFVTINDKPYCVFRQRQDCTQIRKLNILNDIEKVYRIEHETVKDDIWPIKSDDVFRVSIPRFIHLHDIFVIKGVVTGSDSGSFAINIFDEKLKRAFFHMRCNMRSKVIKVNSQDCNQFWGNQEIRFEIESLGFNIDEEFKVAILVKESGFQLQINGNSWCELPFDENIINMFRTMNGIEIISRDNTNVDVKSFEHHFMENEEEDFESWAAEITYFEEGC
jgi:hypothetical protein